MITSKYITSILERYVSVGSRGQQHFTVYMNPTSTNILELKKEAKKDSRELTTIRIIVDKKNKNVYVADAYNAIHADIAAAAHINRDYCVEGSAGLLNSSQILPKINWLGINFDKEDYKDYKWLEPYFDTNWIKYSLHSSLPSYLRRVS